MIKSWLIYALAMWFTAVILPGFTVKGFWGTLKVAAIFGLLNWAFGLFIYRILGIATLGLGFVFAFVTRIVTNAILLKVTSHVSDSLKIKDFTNALVGALIISAVGTVVEMGLRHPVHVFF
jgi:putative membrane protein